MTPDEHHLLVNLLRGSERKGKHLEIGTGAGGTLCIMLNAFTEGNRPSFVVIDNMRYFPNQLGVVKQNLTKNGFDENTIDIRVAESAVAFRRSESLHENFDFILIDGSHKVRAVMADLRWCRLINVGGVICLHDYSARFLGVKMAVNHFLRRNRNYQRIALAGSLLALRKLAQAPCPEINRVDDFYAAALHLPLKVITNWQRKKNVIAAQKVVTSCNNGTGQIDIK